MSGKVDSLTGVQDPVSQQRSSRVMSIAVIGPNESHRKVVSKALSGTPGRTFREFIDYPARLSEIPRIVEQGYGVVMIDVDSDESYALKLIEGFAAAEAVMVMAYSQRNDPALISSCMRAGAREFLPLPARSSGAETGSEPTEAAEAEPDPPSPSVVPQSVPPARLAQAAMSPPPIVPETKSGLPPLVWESEAIEREGSPAPAPEPAKPHLVTKPAEIPSPELPPEPTNSFEAWDAAHLRMTQTANAKPATPPMHTPGPHELFARSRKVIDPPSQSDDPKPPRPLEPPARSAAAPELLARNDRSRTPETPRQEPTENSPVREKKPAPPLPHEMFLKNAPDAGPGSVPADVPLDMFERTPRQVYRPTPQEMTFTSLSKDANEKEKGGGMIWAFLAAGAGMLGCLAFLFFFFAKPANSHPTPAPSVTPGAVQAATPAATTTPSQPDIFDKQFGTSTPAGTAAKPSPRNTATADDSTTATGTSSVSSQMMDQQLSAQSKLSGAIKQPVSSEEPPSGFTPASIDAGSALPGSTFAAKTAKVVPAGAAISGGVAEGLLIRKAPPVYPSIAKSAHMEGTIVIGATITKSGALSNLRVVSGPGMLRQAAMDAVKNWRYRPYMLNNQPIDVDTTISVVFSLSK